jgi:hypothetical protein
VCGCVFFPQQISQALSMILCFFHLQPNLTWWLDASIL